MFSERKLCLEIWKCLWWGICSNVGFLGLQRECESVGFKWWAYVHMWNSWDCKKNVKVYGLNVEWVYASKWLCKDSKMISCDAKAHKWGIMRTQSQLSHCDVLEQCIML